MTPHILRQQKVQLNLRKEWQEAGMHVFDLMNQWDYSGIWSVHSGRCKIPVGMIGLLEETDARSKEFHRFYE